jgi:K+-transporting ATPase KdpF subunit
VFRSRSALFHQSDVASAARDVAPSPTFVPLLPPSPATAAAPRTGTPKGPASRRAAPPLHRPDFWLEREPGFSARRLHGATLDRRTDWSRPDPPTRGREADTRLDTHRSFGRDPGARPARVCVASSRTGAAGRINSHRIFMRHCLPRQATRKEGSHVRSSLPGRGAGLLHGDGRLCPLGRAGLTGMFDLILGGGAALGLAAYLVFALVRPERF